MKRLARRHMTHQFNSADLDNAVTTLGVKSCGFGV
jgi:hypothetical protein